MAARNPFFTGDNIYYHLEVVWVVFFKPFKSRVHPCRIRREFEKSAPLLITVVFVEISNDQGTTIQCSI